MSSKSSLLYEFPDHPPDPIYNNPVEKFEQFVVREVASVSTETFFERAAADNPFLLFFIPGLFFTGCGAIGIYVFDDPKITHFTDSSITIIVNFFIFASVFFMNSFHNRCADIRDRVTADCRKIISVAMNTDYMLPENSGRPFQRFAQKFFQSMQQDYHGRKILIPDAVQDHISELTRFLKTLDLKDGNTWYINSSVCEVNERVLSVCSAVAMAFPPWTMMFHIGITFLQMGIIAPLGYVSTQSKHWSLMMTHAIVSFLISGMFTYSLRTKSPFIRKNGKTSIDKLLNVIKFDLMQGAAD